MVTKPLFAPLNTAGYVFLLLFHIAVATSATVLNALGIAALIKARLPLKQNRFVYVLSTCMSDLCCGASWFYAGIFDVDDASGKLDTCFIQPSFVGISCMSVLFSQLDRYYAIKSPFSYVQRVTRCKTLVVVSLCWLLPVVPIVLINAGPKSTSAAYQSISTLLANIAMFVIMGGMNVKLCLIARSHAKRASRQPNERDTGAPSSYSVIAVAMVAMDSHIRHHASYQHRLQQRAKKVHLKSATAVVQSQCSVRPPTVIIDSIIIIITSSAIIITSSAVIIITSSAVIIITSSTTITIITSSTITIITSVIFTDLLPRGWGDEEVFDANADGGINKSSSSLRVRRCTWEQRVDVNGSVQSAIDVSPRHV
ncbi:unnamed protein product [Lampetra fluviatilis]